MFVVNIVSVPFFTLSVAAFLALLDPESGFLEQLLPSHLEEDEGGA